MAATECIISVIWETYGRVGNAGYGMQNSKLDGHTQTGYGCVFQAQKEIRQILKKRILPQEGIIGQHSYGCSARGSIIGLSYTNAAPCSFLINE
jgi:hypothetical protein